MPGRILDQKGSVKQLLSWARDEWAKEQAGHSAVLFVALAYEKPERPRPPRPGEAQLVDGELGYWEVLFVAREWDRIGPAAPLDFVKALACEVKDTEAYNTIAALRTPLFTNEVVSEDEPLADMDPYGKYKYED